MTDNLFHILTFTATGVICLIIALFTYLFFRKNFNTLISKIVKRFSASVFKKSFGWIIIIIAMTGFFSADFRGCSSKSYYKIIKDREFIVEKNKSQIAKTLYRTILSLFLWTLIVTIILSKRGKKS